MTLITAGAKQYLRCPWTKSAASLPFDLRENFVCFFQSFLAADIKPLARDLEGVDRFARIKPLQKTARLVRIIPRGEISREQR